MGQKNSSLPPRFTIFGRGSYSESLRIGEILRKETVGGMFLVAAAVIALIWANSPVSESYFALRNLTIGYEPWHLELSLGAWAADGLLAIFFFLVGLELKREFVAGDLRQLLFERSYPEGKGHDISIHRNTQHPRETCAVARHQFRGGFCRTVVRTGRTHHR